MLNICPVTATVKGNTGYKVGSFYVIQEFAGDEAGEILSFSGIGIVVIHVRSQISIQGTLGFFIGCLIEIPAVGFAEKYDL